MKRAIKSLGLCVVALTLLVAGLFFPGLPWSARCRHIFKRVSARAEMKASAWQGLPPKLLTISGRMLAKGSALKGVEVEALDSTSGWASITDQQGKFTLPDLMWYPNARYSLMITANDYQMRELEVSAPTGYPETGNLDLGDLRFDRGAHIDVMNLRGKNSITLLDYDYRNNDFYKQLFAELTAEKRTDEEKLLAINQYVANRLRNDRPAGSLEAARYLNFESPRQILEHGSNYCGKLALALATVARAGNYEARVLNVIDEMIQPSAHMVTEVYYGDRWHLFDPTIASPPRGNDGVIPAYNEVRLQTSVKVTPVPSHLPMIHSSDDNWLSGAYHSGFHHYYCFRSN